MKWPTALLCLLGLVACAPKPPQPQAKPITTPFDGMRAAEQRAKDVQKTVDQQAAQQQQQIDAQDH